MNLPEISTDYVKTNFRIWNNPKCSFVSKLYPGIHSNCKHTSGRSKENRFIHPTACMAIAASKPVISRYGLRSQAKKCRLFSPIHIHIYPLDSVCHSQHQVFCRFVFDTSARSDYRNTRLVCFSIHANSINSICCALETTHCHHHLIECHQFSRALNVVVFVIDMETAFHRCKMRCMCAFSTWPQTKKETLDLKRPFHCETSPFLLFFMILILFCFFCCEACAAAFNGVRLTYVRQ